MSSTTDGLLGIPISREAGDGGMASDHNKDARWLSILCRTLIDGPLEPGFMTDYAPEVDLETARITPATLKGFAGGVPIYMTTELEHGGTASSGSTTSLTDPNLYGETNFWQGAYIVFTSGSNAGTARQVASYTPSTHTLTWANPLPTAVQAGDTYVVTYFYIKDALVTGTRYLFASSMQKCIYNPSGTTSILYAPAKFEARGAATPASGEVYIGSMEVAEGAIVSVSYVDAQMLLAAHMGRWETLTGEVEITELGGDEQIEVEITHDPLMLFGGIEVSAPQPHSVTVTQHYRNDRFTILVTNGTSYPASFTVTWTRCGRTI